WSKLSPGLHGSATLASASTAVLIASGSAASPWKSIQSTMSPDSGDPGRSTMRTTGGGVSLVSSAATVLAYIWPARSLSGKIQTTFPGKCCQSVLVDACEPPDDVVAVKPRERAASAAFSPSVTMTGFAFTTSGNL